jgi:triphosphoribosyl-dephospho-CoA synthetase
MILFPYDAYNSWRGAYPAATVQQLMAKLAQRWGEGVAVLEQIGTPAGKEAALELAIARTCHTHFESTANQVEFYVLRDEAPSATPEREKEIRTRLLSIAQREIELARVQYEVACDQSLIGYEASNHYYYTPVDLLEKMLNCEQVIRELRAGAPIGAAKSNA